MSDLSNTELRRIDLTVLLVFPGLVHHRKATDVAVSGALVTLPARVARTFAAGFGLVTAEPPLDVPRFAVSVHGHRQNDADARTRWLREELAACAIP